ncbi:DUF4199 family protein [Terrimonas ferruginea]|uniref:DUF4199 family protein n=1 Tax=Terrimonas ferruginea TaxID=249 RepID=UPI0004901D46|nr:DUF4199 family protein [Terrimonas ferruginea]
MRSIKLTPLVIGLITAAAMILLSILVFYYAPANSPLAYLIYALYGGGIMWTLFNYKASADYQPAFGTLFNQGFRCFIVVTIAMIFFFAINSKMHPEFADEAAVATREYLQQNNKDMTPAQIEESVENTRKGYTTGVVYGAIFSYLIFGVIFTVTGSGIILIRRR